MPRINPLLDSLSSYPIVEIERRKSEVAASGVRIFDFGTGDPSDPTPEFIRQALLQAVTPRCPYPKVTGRPPVRKAIADYMQATVWSGFRPRYAGHPYRGFKRSGLSRTDVGHRPFCREDRLSGLSGSRLSGLSTGCSFCGAEPYPVILDGTDHVFRPWTMPDDVLRKTRLIWINNPHNPSGAITSLEDLKRCVEVCQKYDILLMSDETYADIYQGVRPHSVLEVGTKNVVVLHSLSKRSGMTGYRSGFLAGDPEMIARLKALRANPGLVPQTL